MIAALSDHHNNEAWQSATGLLDIDFGDISPPQCVGESARVTCVRVYLHAAASQADSLLYIATDPTAMHTRPAAESVPRQSSTLSRPARCLRRIGCTTRTGGLCSSCKAPPCIGRGRTGHTAGHHCHRRRHLCDSLCTASRAPLARGAASLRQRLTRMAMERQGKKTSAVVSSPGGRGPRRYGHAGYGVSRLGRASRAG